MATGDEKIRVSLSNIVSSLDLQIFETVNVLCRINAKELTCFALKTCNHGIFGLIMAQEGIN